MYGSDGFLLQFLESSPGRRKQYLPSTLRERMHVHDLLVGLHRTDHLSWLECQVVHGIADQACKAFFASEIQEKADSHELRFTNNRKKNPAERHRAVAMAWARASKKEKKSQKMSSKARAAVKAAAARAKTWLSSRDKRSECGAYFVAARRAFSGCRRLCVSLDASRGGGRKRSHFAMLDLESGVACWGPPQARLVAGVLVYFFHEQLR